MATHLRSLLADRRGGAESQDISAAFLRAARQRWGERVPLVVASARHGIVRVRCPSPLWRTEVLYSAEELKGRVAELLPAAHVRRITTELA